MNKDERIKAMAEGLAHYASTMPYCIDDNPYGQFRWQDYLGEAKAAYEAAGIDELERDAQMQKALAEYRGGPQGRPQHSVANEGSE